MDTIEKMHQFQRLDFTPGDKKVLAYFKIPQIA